MQRIMKSVIILLSMTMIMTINVYSAVKIYDFNTDKDISTNCSIGFDYCSSSEKHSVEFKMLPSSAQSVKYNVNGYDFYFQPFSLNYRNDLGQIQQINTVQDSYIEQYDKMVYYTNLFGQHGYLSYELSDYKLKEKYTFNSNQFINIEQYIIDGGNPTLDIDFQIQSDLDIYIDGDIWNNKMLITTSNIEFRDGDNLIYKLNSPYSYSNNDTIQSNYVLKKQGKDVYIIVQTDYNWLMNTEYPVVIDPTVEYNFSDETGKTIKWCSRNWGGPCPPNGNIPNSMECEFGTIADATNNAAFDASDDSRFAMDVNQYYAWLVFSVNIAENEGDITLLNISYEGRQTPGYDSYNTRLYFLNESSSSYQEYNVITGGSDSWVHEATTDASDYINSSGDVNILVCEDRNGNSHDVDFFQITVTTADGGGGGNTCTAPDINNDWLINMSDNCNITSPVNLGTGRLNFTGNSGRTLCNASINVTGMDYPPASTELRIANECAMLVS